MNVAGGVWVSQKKDTNISFPNLIVTCLTCLSTDIAQIDEIIPSTHHMLVFILIVCMLISQLSLFEITNS